MLIYFTYLSTRLLEDSVQHSGLHALELLWYPSCWRAKVYFCAEAKPFSGWKENKISVNVRIHASMFVKHSALRSLCSSWASTEVQVLSTALPKTLGKACSANTTVLKMSSTHREVCCWDCKELNTRRHCSDLTHQWKTSSKSTQSNATK